MTNILFFTRNNLNNALLVTHRQEGVCYITISVRNENISNVIQPIVHKGIVRRVFAISLSVLEMKTFQMLSNR